MKEDKYLDREESVQDRKTTESSTEDEQIQDRTVVSPSTNKVTLDQQKREKASLQESKDRTPEIDKNADP